MPVYLDGDTPSAQKHGERFGVVGYPTMILFKPDGTEITRLPGGVDVARYARILDVALADARPVSDILAAATQRRRGHVERLEAARVLLLEHRQRSRAAGRPASATPSAHLRQRCPAELPAECARFFFDYLGAAAACVGAAASQPLDGLERADARRRLLATLPSPAVQAANVDNLLYGTRDVIGVLSERRHARTHASSTRAWSDALDRLGGEASAAVGAGGTAARSRARACSRRLDAPGAPLPPALLDAGTPGRRAHRCRDAGRLRATGGDQRSCEPVLGSRASTPRPTRC